MDILALALGAGMLAAVNPCGFAMLPAYLALVVTGEQRTTMAAVVRALTATLLMALGFVVVFGAFGLVITPLGTSVMAYMPALTVVIGLGMAVLGGLMLAGREFTLPKTGKGAPTARLGSMFGYGLGYAIVSLSCTIGPFLAVTSATFRAGSILAGIAAYVTYGLGMALVVGVLAVSVALAGTAVTARIRRILPYVNRIGGVILVVAGLYVAYYGVYELLLFHADRNAEDPIVDGFGRLQTVLARWVDQIGPLVIVIALSALVLLGWVGTLTARARRR
jgi:cytochrome c-type biogenesis protein